MNEKLFIKKTIWLLPLILAILCFLYSGIIYGTHSGTALIPAVDWSWHPVPIVDVTDQNPFFSKNVLCCSGGSFTV